MMASVVIVTESVTWVDFATFVVIFFAAVFAGFQVISQRKAREAQLMTDLSARWDSAALTRARRLVSAPPSNPAAILARMTELEAQDSAAFFALLRLPNFFEDLAILVEEGSISLRVVKKSLAGAIRTYFQLYKLFVESEQKASPSSYEHWEKLYNDLL